MNGERWCIKVIFYVLSGFSLLMLIPAVAQSDWKFTMIYIVIAAILGLIGKVIPAKDFHKL